nr:MAG TPA: hypothetical protein [Bacteriophage sp.]DAR41946.1 MAG TPA: hypothetical protein [Bacteriophage sp.]
MAKKMMMVKMNLVAVTTLIEKGLKTKYQPWKIVQKI